MRLVSLTPRGLLVTTTSLAVFWLVAGLTNGQWSDEASLHCQTNYAKFNRNHTACSRPNGCRISHWGVTKAEQKQIVEWHNYYRNLVASGNETKLGFPSAANMLKMEWDPELAYIAQMHANQCQFAHDCYDCRRTDRHEFVGQNLYVYQTTRTDITTQWPFVVKEWYDEIQIAPPVVAQSFDLFNLNIGHFTQIAWATTNRVGCGYVTYDISGQGDGENSIFKTGQLYTCNYAPGGNFLGEKMYEDGHSASQCPARYRRSKRFTSLCEFARKSNKNVPRNKNTVTSKNKVIKTVTQLTATVPLHPVDPSLATNLPGSFTPISTNSITDQPQSTNSLVTQPETTLFTAPQTQPQTSLFTNSLPSTSTTLLTTLPRTNKPSVRTTRPSTSTSTSTTRRLITSSITKPSTSWTTSSSRTSTSKPITFILQPFTNTKPITTTGVTRTSKRVTNWWDKWSANFANSLTTNTASSGQRSSHQSTTTTRSPWQTWSITISTTPSTSRKPTRSSSATASSSQPLSTGSRIVRFTMSHNGTTLI